MREGNRWDAVINSVNYRLKRDADNSPYRKVTGRSLLEIREILAQGSEQYLSREDVRPMFQTDWSAGALWNKPLLSEKSIDSYYSSTGFDLTSEPGNVFPTPRTDADASTFDLSPEVPPLQVSPVEIYFKKYGSEDVGKWDGSSYTTLTNDFTSIALNAWCWDSENATIFGISTSFVEYVTPDSAGGTVIAHGETIGHGANIFMHYGRLLVWTGERLLHIEDPLGTPAVTTIFDDGMGPDSIEDIATGNTYPVIHQKAIRTGIATSEGVWLVKNVLQDGMPVPFVTRVDRTSDGTNIGTPVATLPHGTVVVDLAYLLGSVIFSTVGDPIRLFMNDYIDYGFPRASFYHLTNNSLGSLGSINGTVEPSDMACSFLGMSDELLLIGGHGGVWAYDPVRGGFHKSSTPDVVSTSGYIHMFSTTDGSDNPTRYFVTAGSYDVVASYPLIDRGDWFSTHELESNYFDGNLPAEIKSIVGITLMTDGINSGETWTVSIEADDGSFVPASEFDTAGAKTTYQSLFQAFTGYRFRYKLTWEATGNISNPSRVKGIIFHMVQGEMVTAWQLVIDGSEARNIENKVVRPEETLSDLEALASKYQIVDYIDEFKETATTHDVRVDTVSIERQNANEIDRAVVVLTEHPLEGEEPNC